MSWIRAGTAPDPGLPRELLAPPELAEARRLVAERERVIALLAAVEARLGLLLLAARDRRGLVGEVNVNVESGEIVPVEAGGPDANHR